MEISSFPLISIGIIGKAYLRNDAIKIVSLARQNIVPVLGGMYIISLSLIMTST